jgi:hypothetical protein
MSRFLHSGHIGDVIAFLPSMRALGGGDLVITDHNHQPHLLMEGFKYDSLKPLLEIQPYIHSVTYEKHPENIDYDVTGFRKYWGQYPIIGMQAKTLGIDDPSTFRWLDVPPDNRTNGRIMCCRSHRYRNDSFPWAQIVEKYRREIIFVGLYDERGDFISRFGNVNCLAVNNLLELAQLIEGSSIFIGNQSAPFWIAAGLNHPVIQETHPPLPDSIVRYEDAHYSIDGDFAPIDSAIKKALDKNEANL